jgi:Tol biopolymer transport system component
MSGEWRIPFVVINGARGEGDAFGLTMSPNGEQFAYVARDTGGFRVIRRGVDNGDVFEKPFSLSEDEGYNFFRKSPLLNDIGKSYFYEIDYNSLAFSPNSKHLAYFARDYESKRSLLAVDDRAYEIPGDINRNTFAPFLLPTFSPDSKSLAYIASKTDVTWATSTEWDGSRAISSNTKEFVVENNKIVGTYDEVVSPLAYSPDGRQLAYTIKDEDGMAVVVNGKKGRRYSAIDTHFSPLFSPDGTRLAYFAMPSITMRDAKWTLVVNGQESQYYDYRPLYSSPIFSPDSKKIAYWAGIGRSYLGQDTRPFVVVDGKESNKYDRVSYDPTLIFSPDSSTLAYQATKEGKNFIVIDSEEGPAYEGISSPTFSPNSQHVAYLAKKSGRWLIVIDGEEGKLYDDIIAHPRFTLDSQYVFYGVKIGDELWQIVETVK